MNPYNFPNVIPAGTVLNSSFVSQPMQVYNAIAFSIQVFFTGTPTGSFYLLASDDPVYSGKAPYNARSGAPGTPVNFTTIAGSQFIVAAAGNCMWDYDWPGFTWVQIGYTDTSGGTSTATVTSSTINVKGM
jgi:hypothetical protein